MSSLCIERSELALRVCNRFVNPAILCLHFWITGHSRAKFRLEGALGRHRCRVDQPCPVSRYRFPRILEAEDVVLVTSHRGGVTTLNCVVRRQRALVSRKLRRISDVPEKFHLRNGEQAARRAWIPDDEQHLIFDWARFTPPEIILRL